MSDRPRFAVCVFTGLSFRLAQRIGEAMPGIGFECVEAEAEDGDTVLSFTEARWSRACA